MAENQHALLALIEKMERLNQFQDKIDTPSNIGQIWDVFVAEFKNLIVVDVCALFLVDKDTHEFVLNNVSPKDQGSVCQREVDLQIDGGMFSWIINRRQPALIPSLVFKGNKSIIMLPLTTSRRTLGVVLVVTPIKESSITQEDLKLVTILLKQCSLVMENTLLYEHLREEHDSLHQANKEIAILSITDPLTGSYNRSYLSKQLQVEIKRSRRYKRHLSLFLCDIDDFKQVNDTFGHQAGDAVLKEFVKRGKELIRKNMDWIVRYGGEEFLFVLPDTNIEGAGLLAERLRVNLSQKAFEFNGEKTMIESSFGVTGFGPDTPDDKIWPEYMISTADRLLYHAKKNGKNTVVSNPLLSDREAP
jgi:diguanylate cyclase (GGDEF)-like protein